MKPLKNLLTILLILLPLSAHAWGVVATSGGVAAAGGGTCGEGGLLFANHFESTTITTGTPAGCSSGDTSGTLDGSAALDATITPQDGTNALYLAAGGRNENFSITSGDIFDDAAFTVDFYYYSSTWADAQKILLVYMGGYTSSFSISTSGTNKITAVYQGGGVTRAVYSPALASPTGTWHHVVISGRVGAYDPSLWISVDGSSPTSNQITNDDLSAHVANSGTLYIGSLDAGTYVAAIDNLKIYNTYTTAP